MTAEPSDARLTARGHAHADILFRPAVRKIGFLDWGAFGRAVEIGYLHARECLDHAGRAWLETG